MTTVSDPEHPGQHVSTVAIQGVRGAFHEIAARQFFGEHVKPTPALTFEELARKTAEGTVDAAVMAIENSIAGSLLGNYALLRKYRLKIVGEVYLRIQQNLLVYPGVQLADLREVQSHPIALAQCREFFEPYPHIRLVESVDTAESAARIGRRRMKHTGAIASTLAAELYGLDILAPSIETNPLNFTRFLALHRDIPAWLRHPNKASVHFVVPHGNEMGSLVKVLSVLVKHGSNMSKIQSVPLVGRPGEYRFFIDFLNDDLAPSIASLQAATDEFELLGVYQSMDIPVEEG
jgi:prephenate dehydratase